MRIPPFLDLLEHEATPHWRSRAFWFDTRLSVGLPGLMIAVVLTLYILLAVKLMATILFYGAPADGVRQFALSLDGNAGDIWLNLSRIIFYVACIFISENVARAALDIAASKPFVMENSKRFKRAALGALALAAAQIIASLTERSFDLPMSGGDDRLVLFAGLTAAVLASLSLAFAQGAEMKKEQDLTV